MSREVPERLKNVRQSGKRTHAQMEDLRIAQVNGETSMIPANRAKSINDEYFRKEYADLKIHDYDADNYHVAMEARLFNNQTGAKVSKPRVQIFDEQTFTQLIKNNGFHGHTTYVLHDPTYKSDEKSPVKQNGNGPGVDDNGKVHDNPGAPVGGDGKPLNAQNGTAPTPPIQLEPKLDTNDESFSLTGTNDNPNPSADETGSNGDDVDNTDPNLIDATNLNESDARKLYMDLTGKSPNGSWKLETLKTKIAEVQGKV